MSGTGISKLEMANAEVVVAKARLFETVAEIQARLAPSRLLDDAVAGVKSTSGELLDSAGGFARKRFGVAAAFATGFMLLLVLRPIAGWLRRLIRRS